MSEQITKKELDAIMKSNPEFAKRIVSNAAIKDSTNPTRVFASFKDAKAALGLVGYKYEDKVCKTIGMPEKNSYDLGTGIIANVGVPYLEATVGKNRLSLGLEEAYALPGHVIAGFEDGVQGVEYGASIVPLRFCIVKDSKTIGHFDPTRMPLVGKFLVSKIEVIVDKETKINAYAEVNCEAGTADFCFKTLDDKEYAEADKLQIIPIVVLKETYDSTIKQAEEAWFPAEPYDGMSTKKEAFIEKLVEGYSDEDKQTIIKFLNSSEWFESKSFSKYLAVYNLEHDSVHPITDAIEANTKKADALSIAAALFPRYGDEWIDIEKKQILLDETTGLPVITESDVANLKIIGLKSDFIKDILTTGSDSYRVAKDLISSVNEEDEKKITAEAYDAECRLTVDLGTDRWVDSLMKDFEAVATKFAHDETQVHSKEHINDIIQQFASLQLTSRRIANKVDGGEFTNMYMQLCNSYFVSLYKKLFEIKDEEYVNTTPFVQFLKIVNDRSEKQSEFVLNKISTSLENTIKLNFKRDKFGGVPTSIFTQAEQIVGDMFDNGTIPAGLSEDEENKRVMDVVFTRFNYLDSLSRTPYKFVGRIFPAVFRITKSGENEKIAEESKQYAESIGLTAKMIDELLGIEFFNTLKVNLATVVENVKGFPYRTKEGATVLRDQLNTYAASLETVKCKGKFDKAKLFAKYFVLLNMYEYVDTLAEGRAKWSGSIEEAKKLGEDLFSVEFENKVYSLKEFEEFTKGKSVAGYVILKKLNDEELDDVAIEWVLRNALFSLFCSSYSYLSSTYVDHCQHTLKDSRSKITEDYFKMCASELGLFVPSISVLEIDGNLNEIVPNDMKIKLGTNAVEDVIKGLDNKEQLVAARNEYLVECLKFVSIAVKGILA